MSGGCFEGEVGGLSLRRTGVLCVSTDDVDIGPTTDFPWQSLPKREEEVGGAETKSVSLSTKDWRVGP